MIIQWKKNCKRMKLWSQFCGRFIINWFKKRDGKIISGGDSPQLILQSTSLIEMDLLIRFFKFNSIILRYFIPLYFVKQFASFLIILSFIIREWFDYAQWRIIYLIKPYGWPRSGAIRKELATNNKDDLRRRKKGISRITFSFRGRWILNYRV